MTNGRDESLVDPPAMSSRLERGRGQSASAPAPTFVLDGVPRSTQRERGDTNEPAPLLEAQFVVRESGRIGFVAQFVAHRPNTPAHFSVGALSFTLAPRNRTLVRRIVVVDGRMPDFGLAELPRAYVERIGSAKELISDLGCAIHARGDLRLSSAIELARGTYAIAAHRDHVHLLYELEPRRVVPSDRGRDRDQDDLGVLLADLRIAPRGSLLTAICALGPESQRPAGPFEPALLDHEGVQLVFGPRARATGHA